MVVGNSRAGAATLLSFPLNLNPRALVSFVYDISCLCVPYMSCAMIDMVTVSAALHRVPQIMWELESLRLQRDTSLYYGDPHTATI